MSDTNNTNDSDIPDNSDNINENTPENLDSTTNEAIEGTTSTHPEANVLAVSSKKESKFDKFKTWAKANPAKSITAGVLSVALIAGGGVFGYKQFSDQPLTDVVPSRAAEGGYSQETIPEAKVISGSGKGNITTIDHEQNGKQVSFNVVGIDADKGVLNPPEEIDKVGWYIGSAPFGVDGHGSTVLTSHINYNGVTGVGALFTSLKKGDPITLTDSDGKEHHYTVSADPVNISKSSQDYVKQTMNTVNKTKGENTLVLVTCGGEFLPGSPLGYADNIVVTADPVPEAQVEDISK